MTYQQLLIMWFFAEFKINIIYHELLLKSKLLGTFLF